MTKWFEEVTKIDPEIVERIRARTPEEYYKEYMQVPTDKRPYTPPQIEVTQVETNSF